MPKRNKDEKDFRPLVNIDRIVHEPARLMILAYLYVVESADFVFLLRQTNLTKGNLSSHLSRLEAAGYIEIDKKFVKKIPKTMLRLTKDGRKAFHEYNQRMRKIFKQLPG
jgi:DNA-binding MarR family transcriptional regulator